MPGFLAYILTVDGSAPIDPGFGNRPIHHPGHPDHGLPSSPGHPGNRPPGSYPGRPDNSLPPIPGLPDHELPPGEPVTINPPPPPPAGYEADVVIGVWNNGVWTFTAYNTDASAGTPLPPTPEPK
jgi:hypothetical protein